jgi:hypothetical protein
MNYFRVPCYSGLIQVTLQPGVQQKTHSGHCLLLVELPSRKIG